MPCYFASGDIAHRKPGYSTRYRQEAQHPARARAEAMRGSTGGLALARPAGEISLLDVVEAMESTVALNLCLLENKTCPLIKVCPVHESWDKARRQLRDELSQATFDQLTARGYALDKRLV